MDFISSYIREFAAKKEQSLLGVGGASEIFDIEFLKCPESTVCQKFGWRKQPANEGAGS